MKNVSPKKEGTQHKARGGRQQQDNPLQQQRLQLMLGRQEQSGTFCGLTSCISLPTNGFSVILVI